MILRAISRVNLWGNYLCRANFTSLKEKPTAGVAIFCEKVCFSENPRFPLGVTYMWISLDVCFNLVLPVFNCIFFCCVCIYKQLVFFCCAYMCVGVVVCVLYCLWVMVFIVLMPMGVCKWASFLFISMSENVHYYVHNGTWQCHIVHIISSKYRYIW